MVNRNNIKGSSGTYYPKNDAEKENNECSFPKWWWWIPILIIGGLIVYGCFYSCNYFTEVNQVVVSGTVIGKDPHRYTTGKHHNYQETEWMIAVRPDNTELYKVYSVNATYSTYCSLKVGDHTAFEVEKSYVYKDYKENYKLYFGIFFILFILTGIAYVGTIIAAIIDIFTKNN